jgi:hypothetical protein
LPSSNLSEHFQHGRIIFVIPGFSLADESASRYFRATPSFGLRIIQSFAAFAIVPNSTSSPFPLKILSDVVPLHG